MVKTFNNISDIIEADEVTESEILNALNGKEPIAVDFMWEYVDPNNYPHTKKYYRPMINTCGRMYATLFMHDEKIVKNYYIDRIIADRYLPDRPHPKAYVNHIDHNLNNNKIENLQWAKPSYVCIVEDYINEVEECDTDPENLDDCGYSLDDLDDPYANFDVDFNDDIFSRLIDMGVDIH